MVSTLIGLGSFVLIFSVVAFIAYKEGYNTGYRHGRSEGELNMLGRILNQIGKRG